MVNNSQNRPESGFSRVVFVFYEKCATIICMVKLNLDTIRPILIQNHIKFVGIFGSRSKGNYRPDSDIDLLIQFDEGKIPGLFEFISLQRKLSEALGIKVDLVTKDSLSPHIKESVLQALQTIYQS